MMGGILKQLVAALGLRLPDILKLLEKILASFRRTFICIDGLDEYAVERRPEFLRSLQQVLRDSPTTRLFLAGRQHLKEEVKKHLSESVPHLAIKPHESDIKKYINKKISDDPDPDARSGELESEIITRISESSSDILFQEFSNECYKIFLVVLQIDAILGETSIHRRRQKLHQQAYGLHDVYAATLDRIRRQLLLRVSLAQRSLSAKIGSADFNTENIPPIQTLLGSCLGLVTVDKETSREYLQAHTTLFGNGHAKIAEVRQSSSSINGDTAGKHAISYLRSIPLGIPCREENDRVRFSRRHDHVSGSVIDFRAGIREEGSPFDSLRRDGCQMFGLHCALVSTDINQQDFRRSTPLEHAARCGSHSIFALLLRDPNIRADISDEGGITPLFLARLLTMPHVSPDTKTSWGGTPLHIAALNGHANIVKLLLSWSDLFLNLYNFDPNIPNNHGRTPLSFAAECGHIEVVEMLLAMDNIDLNPVDGDGDTPILLLLDCNGINRNQVVVMLLLERGDCDLNARDLSGATPLELAVQYGYVGIVGLLTSVWY
ncbi:ankyrin [Choiromyces venosus 120613-1]|uniref:Ankyrin n=1 Tax=Choiromyces venosus 120613-1 TaxID=1336337 RepID=A0A3N4IWD8_9PEZI|nr:ankyrin [Choiromyces venosus 120613-1]